MGRFVRRYKDRIVGIVSGFDRLLFRGTLRSISYAQGMEAFLCSQGIRYKDFGPFAEKVSNSLKAHAEDLARRWKRPFQYLASPKVNKEEWAQRIAQRDGVTQGLVCVLSCVEPCHSFSIQTDPETQKLRFVSRERKCLHLYFYYLDREFGLMHVRLQTWLPLAVQVCVNGREWLARRMQRAGMAYQQCDNCFTRIDQLDRAQQMLDSLTARQWARRLKALARRVNPWLASAMGRHVAITGQPDRRSTPPT